MNKSDQEFLTAINECEINLFEMGFQKHSFYEKGYACYVEYKKGDFIVEFNYGPPEYEVQMILFNKNRIFEFKDLLDISSVSNWVHNNRYVQQNERNLKNELVWFIEMLKISLPIISDDKK